MKNTLTLICILWLVTGIAQQGWYVEGKTDVKMMGISMLKTTYKIWTVPGKSLMEADIPFNKQPMKTLTLETEETMTGGGDCYHDTKENIKKIRDKKVSISNIKVKKEKDTKKILGYECKKAILTYDAKGEGGSLETENEVWYTEELKGEGVNTGSQGGETGLTEYAKVLEELGAVLMSVATTSGTKATATITKIEKKEIPDETFTISTEKCKKVMNYEEFQEEMDRRQREQRSSSNMFPHH